MNIMRRKKKEYFSWNDCDDILLASDAEIEIFEQQKGRF
jgi:hypothetical protein